MSEGRLDETESNESLEETAINIDSNTEGEGFKPRGYTPPIIITDGVSTEE